MSDLENPEVFRTVLESLKMGICAVDRDRKIAFWNDGAGEITGYLRQEVLGRSCREGRLARTFTSCLSLKDYGTWGEREYHEGPFATKRSLLSGDPRSA